MSKNNNFEPKENKYTPLKPLWTDGRIPVNRVIETNSDKNHYYYGRFETYRDGGHRSFQSWTGKPSERLNTGKVIDELNFSPHLSEYLKDNWRDAEGIESISGNVSDLEWMNQIGERNWPSSLPENKSEKNEFTHKLEIDYLPERSKITGSSGAINWEINIKKENQELKQQLAEVQKKLAEVLSELKNLKGGSNDELVNELTQTQAKNQQLISTDNISDSQVREQVQKSEALLNGVKVMSFAPNSNKKENSVMPYVVGGSFILAISGMVGLLLLKKKNKT